VLNEFDIINSFFTKQHKRKDVVKGVGDDCAILRCSLTQELITTSDTLVVNRHFFPSTKPFDVGYKSGAVSLSDIAAMGGDPAWLLLSLTLPDANEDWLRHFSKGLFEILLEFNVDLVGGNTARGPLSVTTQLMGFVEKGRALLRSNAKPGDLIFVTHTLGNAALALNLLTHEVDSSLFAPDEIKLINQSLWRPVPRVQEGKAISHLANSAIDISDGLLADLSHILKKSQVGAVIFLDQIPLPPHFERLPYFKRYELALTVGDDYELCFTLPVKHLEELHAINSALTRPFTCIGEITQTKGLVVKNAQREVVTFNQKGYQHFN
jgi:thiamine-monophosphate kinase